MTLNHIQSFIFFYISTLGQYGDHGDIGNTPVELISEQQIPNRVFQEQTPLVIPVILYTFHTGIYFIHFMFNLNLLF